MRVKADSIWLKSQTESAECFSGGPLRLEVEAVSVAPVEYRWYKVGRKACACFIPAVVGAAALFWVAC